MKILISAYTGLGNFILKTPMIRKLREIYPDVQIDIIAGNSFGTEYILKEEDIINKKWILPTDASIAEKYIFFKELRREKYDAIFLPFDADPNFLMLGSYIAGIKWRVKHFLASPKNLKQRLIQLRKRIFYPKTRFVALPAGRHEIDLNYDLLEAYLKQVVERSYDTIVQFERSSEVLQKFDLHREKYILIQPGAANGELDIKSWSTDNFVKLITELQKKYDEKIVLAGDKGDLKKFIEPLLQKIENQRQIINTAAATSLPELFNLIDHARLVICHDSGIMHIADALHKPLIALYGPTDYTRTKPLKKTSHLLFSKNEYFAAMYNFNMSVEELATISKHRNLLDGITVEMVLEKVKELLSKDVKISS